MRRQLFFFWYFFSSPTSSSVGVDRQSHDALLAEVARLEEALEDVRRDVEGLSGVQDGCQQLDRIQQTVREKVPLCFYLYNLVKF